MRKFTILFLLIPLLLLPVRAQEIEVPQIPITADRYMPEDTQSFAEGLLYILSIAVKELLPDVAEGIRVALLLICAALATSFISSFGGMVNRVTNLVAVCLAATVLIGSANSLIHLGVDTIKELDSYGKLLLPVMTTALASEGALAKSAALYGGTMIFSTILTSLITKLFVPMMYIFIVLCIANRAIGEDMLANFKSLLKWMMTWLLKLALYIFTGYITVTGVVSGSADATTLKATKITLSGMIPVVGGIISDASEAILVGAGVMKNAAGIYGILAFIAICIGPFLKIGVQSVILKTTGAVCSFFGLKSLCGLVEDFSQAMTLLLAATGSICLLLLISTVAFMKGVH